MERLLPALEGAAAGLPRGRGGARPAPRREERWTSTSPSRATPARPPARSPSGSAARRASTSASAPRRSSAPDGRTYNLATTRPRAVRRAPARCRAWRAATLAEDLAPRDFSVNAMAIGLTGDDLGHLYDPLRRRSPTWTPRSIRVLHDRQLPRRSHAPPARGPLRGPARTSRSSRRPSGWRARPWPRDALATVSGNRIGADLMRPAPRARGRARRSELLRELEIHSALHPELDPDPELVASAALGAAAIGADRGVAALAALVESAPEKLDLWLADLDLVAEERDAAARAARVGPRIATALREREHSPSELRALLAREPLEALALALAPARALRGGASLGHGPARRGARDLRRRPARGGRARRARPSGARSRRRFAASSTASSPAATRSSRPRCCSRGSTRSEAARRARSRSRPARGGVSEGPYESLNLGILTDDEPENVTENRRRAAAEAAVAARARRDGLAGARHGLLEWDAPPHDPAYAAPGGKDLPRVDGHLTREPGIGLLVLVADCYPGRALGRRAGGDAPLRLAAARRRDPRGARSIASTAFRPRPSARASAAAATRWATRCSRRSRASRERPRGGCSTSARVIAAKLAAAGVTDVQHVDRCTSCEPELYFSHRRDARGDGPAGGDRRARWT